MSSYPIESTSLSFNDIKQNITDFVKSKPDASRWIDFYTGSEGTILIELIAGLGFYTALKIIFSREETYLQYANTLLSARAIAQNLSYSAFRGTNRRYKISFVPTVTVSIPAFTVIGYQGDYDFICLEDTVLNEGEEATIYGAVGVFNSVSVEVPSSDLHVFKFNDELISNDYKLYLNDEELPVTDVSAEALEDKYLVQSNAVGGVNVIYLNVQEGFEHKYQTGDILRLDYIQYQKIPYSSEIHIDYASDVTIDSTETTVVPETIESIQNKASLTYETQLIIRGREDYTKNFLLMRAKFKDTTSRDLSPAYVELSYVQDDQSILTESEEETLFTKLTYKRMLGIPLPYINKPRHMKIDLDINLKLNSSNIALTEYNEKVATLMNSEVEYKFSDDMEEVTVDLAELERQLEQIDNVKRAHVYNSIKTIEKNEYYEVGDVFASTTNSNLLYRVTNIAYRTNSSEPDWNYELGSLTVDRDVVWKAVPKSGYPNVWEPDEPVCLYDLRVPTSPEKNKDGIMFRVVQGKSLSSASTEPEWNTTLGERTLDSELIWIAVEYVATAPKWEPNTWYDLGDIIKSGENSYQVIGERRKASASLPNFASDPDEIIYENLVLTKEELEEEQISLPWGTYCTINPTITASIY
jgi:hypothetical protein